MSENIRTDFLTPTSTFVIGMGTVLNLAGNYFVYNTSGSSEEADLNAIASDWQMVGKDIQQAIQRSGSSEE